MRGYHDELGGPESIAGSEWGPLSFGDDVTAAGLPASPGYPATRALAAGRGKSLDDFVTTLPSEDTLRHNFLLRRSLNDPGYGASRGFDWRESALVALGVAYVPPAHEPQATRFAREHNLPIRPKHSG